MFGKKLRETWIALWFALATVAPVCAAEGPGANFKLDPKAPVFTSPDKTIQLEQYFKENKDGDWVFQFWTFDADHRHPSLLTPGEDDSVAGYAAGFRFSPDSRWLVRMQKLGSGSQTLFLYRRKDNRFSAATRNRWPIWPGIISSPRRPRRGCIATQRTSMASIMPLWRWSRGWRKTTPGWGSIGRIAATSLSACRSTCRVKI